jgi:hypothetical protein
MLTIMTGLDAVSAIACKLQLMCFVVSCQCPTMLFGEQEKLLKYEKTVKACIWLSSQRCHSTDIEHMRTLIFALVSRRPYNGRTDVRR